MKTMESNSSSIKWMMWVVASAFYAYQYILRVMPNIIIDDIMLRFDVSAAAFGQFSGVYYIGYSLIHLPIGLMLDRYGPKKIMTGCILLTVVGMLPLVFSTKWTYPIIGRLLVGIGSSAAILGVFKIIRMGFSEKRFPRMLSISVTIGLLGAIYGGAPVNYMHELLGVESIVTLFAGCGLLLAVATYSLIPHSPAPKASSIVSDVQEVVKNRRVILTCLFAGLMVGPLEGFADVWGSVFFKQVYGLDGNLAASLPSMIFIGMCFGSPILSLLAEKTGSYLTPVIGAAVVMAGGFSILICSNWPPSVVSLLFFLIGICCAYQILAIYKVSTHVRDDVAGLATALANMIIMLFGYLFHGVIGTVINAFGGIDSSTALLFGISVIPITLCIGAGGFAYLQAQEKIKLSTAE